MFYSQPLATRFGTNLINILQASTWTSLDIAVAWVRASGVVHLEPALSSFLKAGNKVRIIVGVDLENTTKEGLARLLALETQGSITVFVHHNESGPVFHPKLYLFQNKTQAKLIVASNNITESGLYRNTEAGLEIDDSIDSSVIVSVRDALDSWSDPKYNLARRLDAGFLEDLVANGYVPDEATARAQYAKRVSNHGKTHGAGKKLFGGVSVTSPSQPISSGSPTKKQNKEQASTKATATGSTSFSTVDASGPSQTATGQVLLMRVRKARGTQVQIPLAVMREPFFSGVTHVLSVASQVTRGIHPTHPERAKGSNPNTLKLEMPETRELADPVARFERTASGEIQYEVYDASTAQGKMIMQALESGRSTFPPSTHLTLPSSPTSATWWRFI